MQSKITKGMGMSDGFDEEDEKLRVLEQLIGEMDELEGAELSTYKAEAEAEPDMVDDEEAMAMAMEGGASSVLKGEEEGEADLEDDETRELRDMVRKLLARESAA